MNGASHEALTLSLILFAMLGAVAQGQDRTPISSWVSSGCKMESQWIPNNSVTTCKSGVASWTSIEDGGSNQANTSSTRLYDPDSDTKLHPAQPDEYYYPPAGYCDTHSCLWTPKAFVSDDPAIHLECKLLVDGHGKALSEYPPPPYSSSMYSASGWIGETPTGFYDCHELSETKPALDPDDDPDYRNLGGPLDFLNDRVDFLQRQLSALQKRVEQLEARP